MNNDSVLAEIISTWLATQISRLRDYLQGAKICPCCGTKLVNFRNNLGAKPVPNDTTVCAHCGEFLYFTKNMELSKLFSEKPIYSPGPTSIDSTDGE